MFSDSSRAWSACTRASCAGEAPGCRATSSGAQSWREGLSPWPAYPWAAGLAFLPLPPSAQRPPVTPVTASCLSVRKHVEDRSELSPNSGSVCPKISPRSTGILMMRVRLPSRLGVVVYDRVSEGPGYGAASHGRNRSRTQLGFHLAPQRRSAGRSLKRARRQLGAIRVTPNRPSSFALLLVAVPVFDVQQTRDDVIAEAGGSASTPNAGKGSTGHGSAKLCAFLAMGSYSTRPDGVSVTLLPPTSRGSCGLSLSSS